MSWKQESTIDLCWCNALVTHVGVQIKVRNVSHLYYGAMRLSPMLVHAQVTLMCAVLATYVGANC